MSDKANKKLHSIYVQEGFGYSKEKLIEKLKMDDFDQKSAVALITQLIDRRLLNKYTKKTEQDDYARDQEDFDYDESRNWSSLSFSFVGLYYYNGILIKSFPKYIETEKFKTENNDDIVINFDEESKKLLSKFKIVLKVIIKYKNRHKQKVYSYEEADGKDSRLSLILTLLEDYYDNGLYSNDQIIKQVNGNGEIDWNGTVNNFYPMIKDNRPYYFDYQTIKRISDDNNIVHRIHKIVLTKCSQELEECDLLELLDLPEVNLTEEELSDLGDNSSILYFLEAEMNQQFNTRKQTVLKMMKAYIENEGSINNDDELKLIRVNKFEHVWEEVCRVAVGDDLETPLGDMIVNKLKNSSSDTLKKLKNSNTFKDVMESPKWYPDKNKQEYALSSPLKLDSIKYYNGALYIFDAKYYIPSFKDRKSESDERYYLNDEPGSYDIMKQFLYQLAFKDFSKETNVSIKRNVFLMPKDSRNEPDVFSSIKMDMFQKLCSKIEVIQVSAEEMYDCYLRNLPKDLKYFLEY